MVVCGFAAAYTTIAALQRRLIFCIMLLKPPGRGNR